MSELGADAMRGVPWPSNGLTEIPFRVYTDPEQYRLEQERIFKGPTWSFLCLASEITKPGDYVATTIGETAVIGRRVRLYQGVTLGARRFETDENGALAKNYSRHPILEDEVVVYAGAAILGRITVGRGSVIAGSVWLTHSVPPGSFITQAKSRAGAFNGGEAI